MCYLLRQYSKKQEDRLMAKSKPTSATKRVLDARPDTLDFRDRMYEPTLVEVPTRIALEEYRKYEVPILDQGQEGACTGFGLATVAHYLLRRRSVVPDQTHVSPRMIYQMAKRYDEWPGEDYVGSSARGAMKGWHKHGICSAELWPYRTRKNASRLTEQRTADAVQRPLGAYFRVNHKDLVALHGALAEVGVLYASASVHGGWNRVGEDGIIPYPGAFTGGHAFAIVAYDVNGFWIQNSWGEDWGRDGFGCITYDDWLENGTDVWVARLGAPVRLVRTESTAASHAAAARQSAAYSYADLRPHIISVGNGGAFDPAGTYGTSKEEVEAIFTEDIPRVMGPWPAGQRHLLLYAHGGLVGADAAVQRLADYRSALLAAHVYPISFIWHSDYWTTLTNMLRDALNRRRPEGALDAAKDFMLDRLDDALEPLARTLTGKAEWDEMKENALAATESARGGVSQTLDFLAALKKGGFDCKLHVVGHSAGSILLAPLVRLLTAAGKIGSGDLRGRQGYGIAVDSCTLWAPACTVELFKQAYLPAITAGDIRRFALFALTDAAERDDNCANIYHKSLLYLVSDAFEAEPRIPLFRDGVPLLGMEKFLQRDDELKGLFKSRKADLILAPNAQPAGSPASSTARHHGDFDDDLPTVRATLARILGDGKPAAQAAFAFHRSGSSLRSRRLELDRRP
jgi:papain like protease